ncbi:phosphoglycolate phosphatase [Nitrosomonas cryotolerans]|uniref:Phosphoglycolate phosphatase n=1 Tax=Nitrosomonas cryotolerans ATCC 49181 TaxID=1131553 RepID=A0A1N6I8M5_9PROT|nr:HAD-IA family hydrolase [Nitrosomonas cryotolerans]SFP83019.1 phosphoglycolate phosphatase [Nitrosomonas cryotolerans]SIO28353.1 phosphoglycolate phosphatase [Nitrosomonas cryotolerans ATCC 49181]
MIKAVLLDLDGTVADTAPDLGHALNRQRSLRGLAPLPMTLIRTEASAGARGLLRLGFNIQPDDAHYEGIREEFLNFYSERLCHDTILFSGMSALLDQLDARSLPWGIVTNKPSRFTHPLMQQLGLHQRAACIISGDETAHSKPHPEPLLVASRKLMVTPAECIYLGDDIRDVKASLAAGMEPIIARYGYLGNTHPPETWGAKYLIDHPQDLLNYL